MPPFGRKRRPSIIFIFNPQGIPIMLKTAYKLSSVLGLLLAAGCASPEKPSAEFASQVTMTAQVVAIDQAKRKVTLKGPNGKQETIKVGEEVRNLARVKVGDEVKVAYIESVAVDVKRPDEATPGVTGGAALDRAEAGEKPAGVAVSQVTVTTTLAEIDPNGAYVILTGPDGNQVKMNVRDRSKLKNVKVGDRVVITYTESLAVSVEKVSAPSSSGY
jgi:Cu/Ag efflux protein CusF